MGREDEIDTLKREVGELKEQIAQLKKSGGWNEGENRMYGDGGKNGNDERNDE